ncbi:MAG: ATP synthase F1 subunit delta [Ichthyobacteriaceae bacterium]|nr:ATP synthase F1 subunit delta [Ichthyobacteriaceae bacterium]
MSRNAVAYRYAKSLMTVARKQDILEEVYQDMLLVKNTLEENKNFLDYIESPIVKTSAKLEIAEKIFSGKINELSLNFLQLLGKNGREGSYRKIVKRFVFLYDEIKGIEVAKVISAKELTDDQFNRIKMQVAKITGKIIDMEIEIDSKLIGGFILKVGDYKYDASVKRSMERLHREFKGNLYISKI